MENKLKTTEEEIKTTYAKLRELELRHDKEYLESISANDELIKPLTIKLHNMFCRYNHTDGCGWGYEEQADGSGWIGKYNAHAIWLDRTRRICHKHGTEKVAKMVDIVNELIKNHPDFIYMFNELRSDLT